MNTAPRYVHPWRSHPIDGVGAMVGTGTGSSRGGIRYWIPNVCKSYTSTHFLFLPKSFTKKIIEIFTRTCKVCILRSSAE